MNTIKSHKRYIARKGKPIAVYFFSVLAGLLLLGFFIRYEWFLTHTSVDWKKLAPTINSVRFTEPILVIESDDWGWNPGNSRLVADSYRAAGYTVPFYAEYSFLETPQEVDALVDMLAKHKDCRGKPAVLTANIIMANIGFEAIRKNDFSELVLIALDSNSVHNPVSERLISEYTSGMKSGAFWPQLHGLHHINKDGWLKGLKENEPFAAKAFLFDSVPLAYAGDGFLPYNSFYSDFSTMPSTPRPYGSQLSDIKDAIAIFRRIFGFVPRSSIAPFYIWDDNTENALYAAGIRYIQAGNMQVHSRKGDGSFRRKYHSLGQKSDNGIIYLERSFSFEPQQAKESTIKSVKQRIRKKFSVRRPVVISSHRLNYVGVNAKKHRNQLDQILAYIEGRFPNVLYMSSEDLATLVEKDNADLIIDSRSFAGCALIAKDILLYLPGVWYPLLFAFNGGLLLICKHFRKAKLSKLPHKINGPKKSQR